MSRHFLFTTILVPTVFLLGIAGCGGGSTEPAATETGHDHAHGIAGPHGGSLIELGNEEYHAELVHDDAAGTITVYVLDSAAKASVPIEVTDVTINLKHEGQGEQFTLAAAPEPGDPEGRSSKFVSSDSELAEDLDREGSEPQLAITINGRSYRGAIEHHHGHDGENHDHSHQ
jgi:hypothetical protein